MERTPTRILRRPATQCQPPTTEVCPKKCVIEMDVWINECEHCLDGPLKSCDIHVILLSRLIQISTKDCLKNLKWLSRLLSVLSTVHHVDEAIDKVFDNTQFLAENMALYARTLVIPLLQRPITALKYACILNDPETIVWTFKHLTSINQDFGEHLKCPVCLDQIKDGVITTCSHWFCAKCFETTQTVQNTCPLCRADTFSISCDRLLDPMRQATIKTSNLRIELFRVLMIYSSVCAESSTSIIAPLLSQEYIGDHLKLALHTCRPMALATIKKYSTLGEDKLLLIFVEELLDVTIALSNAFLQQLYLLFPTKTQLVKKLCNKHNFAIFGRRN